MPIRTLQMEDCVPDVLIGASDQSIPAPSSNLENLGKKIIGLFVKIRPGKKKFYPSGGEN